MATLDELMELLDSSHTGLAAKKKTRTVLNRLWLEPRPGLVGFSAERVEIPWTQASWITATRAFSAVRRGSRKHGTPSAARCATPKAPRAASYSITRDTAHFSLLYPIGIKYA
jgi:hypothetical protein